MPPDAPSANSPTTPSQGPQTNPTIPRLAIASFFLSLSSFICGPIGFVPGILCGHLAQRRTARDPALEDPGFARSGLILGYTFYGLTIIAIALFLLYSAFTTPLRSRDATGRHTQAQLFLDTLEEYLETYRERHGAYPTTEQTLSALYQRPTIAPIPPNWSYTLPPNYAIDPWERPFHYRQPGIRNPKAYDLSSLGPDGKEGTPDDIICR